MWPFDARLGTIPPAVPPNVNYLIIIPQEPGRGKDFAFHGGFFYFLRVEKFCQSTKPGNAALVEIQAAGCRARHCGF